MTKAACLALAMLQVVTYIPTGVSEYIGGTVSAIPQQARGELITDDEKVLSFQWAKSGKTEGGKWQVPYEKVTYLGYGQHAGRRVGATVAGAAPASATIVLAPVFVPLMWSKKRRHYLTIGCQDEQGAKQVAIFLVGKKAIRVILKVLEVRTGKKVEYEDEEARRTGNK